MVFRLDKYIYYNLTITFYKAIYLMISQIDYKSYCFMCFKSVFLVNFLQQMA